jgi:hypothetical protein
VGAGEARSRRGTYCGADVPTKLGGGLGGGSVGDRRNAVIGCAPSDLACSATSPSVAGENEVGALSSLRPLRY